MLTVDSSSFDNEGIKSADKALGTGLASCHFLKVSAAAPLSEPHSLSSPELLMLLLHIRHSS